VAAFQDQRAAATNYAHWPRSIVAVSSNFASGAYKSQAHCEWGSLRLRMRVGRRISWPQTRLWVPASSISRPRRCRQPALRGQPRSKATGRSRAVRTHRGSPSTTARSCRLCAERRTPALHGHGTCGDRRPLCQRDAIRRRPQARRGRLRCQGVGQAPGSAGGASRRADLIGAAQILIWSALVARHRRADHRNAHAQPSPSLRRAAGTQTALRDLVERYVADTGFSGPQDRGSSPGEAPTEV
jgi:hypothetical protein